jgi:hypothetical protein
MVRHFFPPMPIAFVLKTFQKSWLGFTNPHACHTYFTRL